MEVLDLNHAASESEEAETNACCNAVSCASCQGSACSFKSRFSSSSSSSLSSSIYSELWHACAGPLTCPPRKGNVVVYFPQGHLEQKALNFDLPPQIFCRVVDVQLLANKENDEVYTQLLLLPQQEWVGFNLERVEAEDSGWNDDGNEGSPSRSTPHMFCKTLTASDTSTHGGFSVPRRAAEDCFPPLDYKQQRPSQELVANDLHGVVWKFRHIYRGQPRRHLLTTGWSSFVSQKNLMSGDAVLFLRGEDGKLRLGIRRAARPRNFLPNSISGTQKSDLCTAALVANALCTKSLFRVFYRPRSSHADFIVPYQKYMKSMANLIRSGTRFRMKTDVEDAPDRRCNGVVTGISDLDPYRWPNSKWKCLMVRWEGDIGLGEHQGRVSPWEIDPLVSVPPLCIQPSPRLKKLRTSLQSTDPENPVTGGFGFLDFEESLRSSKVLQGQENQSLAPRFHISDARNCMLDFEMRQPAYRGLVPVQARKACSEGFEPLWVNHQSYMGSEEANQFLEVLQGREICKLKSLSGKPDFTLVAGKPLLSYGSFNGDMPKKFDATPTGRLYFPQVVKSGIDPMARYISSGMENGLKKMENLDQVAGCKVFGISLTQEAAPNSASLRAGKQSCTKVHKQGSLMGRAIDLWRLGNYGDMVDALEEMFGMKGQLRDPNRGWRILYTDSENDVMAVGDEPWHEFVNVVSKIHIYTKEEVEKMTAAGIMMDDTRSCLEQSPAFMEASKSSSVWGPESSPTVLSI